METKIVAEYKTVRGISRGEYEEKRSRFLAVMIPVASVQEVSEQVAAVQKEHFSAKHHCFAYRLLDGQTRQADDGEPHGTGGKPILDLLCGEDLYNVLVIVTRYFGGVLLGTGGLSRAYGAAARAAWEAAEPVIMEYRAGFTMTLPYAGYEKMQAMLYRAGAVVESAEYTDSVCLRCSVPVESAASFALTVKDFSAGTIVPQSTGFFYGQKKRSVENLRIL